MTGLNPFVNRIKIDRWRYRFQILFMTIFVVPFRLTIYLTFFFITYCLAFAASLIDNDFSRPLSGIRMCLFHLMNELIVWGHVLGIGFQVKIVGERAPVHVAPILVCAPHSSFFDVLAHCSMGTPTVVGKMELFSVPVIARMLYLTVPIIIDRKDKEGRRRAMETIGRRARELFASNPEPTKSNFCSRKIFRNAVRNENRRPNLWPQICIFPEGTCTNRTQLITFRAGAFHPGLPVQPICFKWSTEHPHDVVSWTWEGASLVRLMWLAMCNISNKLEIYYLPVYVPNELEKLDPHLFARNVRRKMAECLNIPVSEFTLDDAIYLTDYGRPTMEQFRSLCQNAGLPSNNNYDNESMFDRSELDVSPGRHARQKNGETINKVLRCGRKIENHYVTFEEFCNLVQCQPVSAARRLFNAFDWHCSPKIDFREYQLARLASRIENDRLYIVISCRMMNLDRISKKSSEFTSIITKILRFPFEMTSKECRRFSQSLPDKPIDGDLLYLLAKQKRSIKRSTNHRT